MYQYNNNIEDIYRQCHDSNIILLDDFNLPNITLFQKSTDNNLNTVEASFFNFGFRIQLFNLFKCFQNDNLLPIDPFHPPLSMYSKMINHIYYPSMKSVGYLKNNFYQTNIFLIQKLKNNKILIIIILF